MDDIVEKLNRVRWQLDQSVAHEARDTITTLRAEVRKFAALAHTEAQYIRSLEAELAALRAINERLESELTDALTDLDSARQDNASLTPYVQELRATNERMTAALEWIDNQRYVDRATISQDTAYQRATRMNTQLLEIMDCARTALAQEPTNDR